MFYVEHQITNFYKFDAVFKLMAHALTFDHLIYQAVVTNNNMYLEKFGAPKT